MTAPSVRIADRLVGDGHPVFVIAELSANHHQDIDVARRMIRIAAEAGADAVKLQTYTADSMTLDVDKPEFIVGPGTVWEGRRLFELYEDASTPYEWYPVLVEDAADVGLLLFSTPFDTAAVDFLEQFEPPAYKIASFELLDLPLIRHAASTGRPLIMSTGMATEAEIDDAVAAAASAGDGGVVLLRCNSAYPARADEMDLSTITHMTHRWRVPVGLSDHTLSPTVATAAVALGACVLEKHFIERRGDGGPDSGFSLEPLELAATINSVRMAQAALGQVRYGPSPTELPSLRFRRSLWFVTDLVAGTVITADHVRAVRPAGGLPPGRVDDVVGRTLTADVERASPVLEEYLGPV